MSKKLAMSALFLLTLIASFPHRVLAENAHYTGRVTALTATSITIFDKAIITLAIDDRTTVVPWIREKPFVREAVSLTPSAVRVGSLVTVRTRGDARVADVVRVSSDLKKTFSGRVVAFTEASLSVYDPEMAVVTLRMDDQTSFTQLFTVKPWVRKAVHLASSDLKVGALVNLFPSKIDATLAGRVEIATDEALQMPVLPSDNAGN